MHVAFLGLGTQGAAMAGRLLDSGVALTVWNRSRARAGPLLARGAISASSPAEAASGTAIVCLCLTDGAAVEDVVFGPDGVAFAPPVPGGGARLVIDFSTIGPEAARRLAARARMDAGIDWLDAPVSGGPGGAAAGRLVIFCGGTPAAYARAAGVLAPLASRSNRLGEAGAGQAMKLCNQLIVSVGMLALAEAVALGRAGGVEVERIAEELAGGYADSRLMQLFGRRMACAIEEPKTGRIATMHKDAELISQTAQSLGLPLRVAEAAVEAYRACRAQGLSDLEFSLLPRLYAPRNSGDGTC